MSVSAVVNALQRVTSSLRPNSAPPVLTAAMARTYAHIATNAAGFPATVEGQRQRAAADVAALDWVLHRASFDPSAAPSARLNPTVPPTAAPLFRCVPSSWSTAAEASGTSSSAAPASSATLTKFNELLVCDSTVLHRIGTVALPRLDLHSSFSAPSSSSSPGGRQLHRRLRLVVPFSSLLLLRMQAAVSGTDLEHSEAYSQLRFLGQCGSQFSSEPGIGAPSPGAVKYTELASLQPESLAPLTFLPPSEELLLLGLALAPQPPPPPSPSAGGAAMNSGEALVRAARFFQQPLRALQAALEENQRQVAEEQRVRALDREYRAASAIEEEPVSTEDNSDTALERAFATAPPLLRDGVDGGWGGEVLLRVACGLQHRLNATARTEPCVAGVASKAPVVIKRAWAAGVRCESLATIMATAASASGAASASSEDALGSPTPVDAHRAAAAQCARVARRFARREAGLVSRGSTLPSFLGGAGRANPKHQ